MTHTVRFYIKLFNQHVIKNAPPVKILVPSDADRYMILLMTTGFPAPYIALDPHMLQVPPIVEHTTSPSQTKRMISPGLRNNVTSFSPFLEDMGALFIAVLRHGYIVYK